MAVDAPEVLHAVTAVRVDESSHNQGHSLPGAVLHLSLRAFLAGPIHV